MNDAGESTLARLVRWFLRDGQVWIVVASLGFLAVVCLRYWGVFGGRP